MGQRNLEVEIKYRITIYNLSQSLETQITEVVDYYDDSLQLTSAVVNTNGKIFLKINLQRYLKVYMVK